MKKYLLTFLLFGFYLNLIFGQKNDIKVTDSAKEYKHEITLNTLYLISGFPEINYEYLIDEDSSVGLSYAINGDSGFKTKYSLTPHYRLYMGKKRAGGFFMEGNGFMVYTAGDYGDYVYDPVTQSYEYQDTEYKMYFGLGIAVGGKFIVKDTWITELSAGLGRLLNDSQENLDVPLYPRIGISIGKRF